MAGPARAASLVAPGTDQLSQNFDQLTESTSQLAPSMNQFGMNMGNVTQQLTTTTPQLQSSLTSLTNTVGQNGAGVGQALQNTSNTVLQSGQGLGNAFQQAAQALQSGGGGGGIGGFFKSLFGGGGGGDPFSNGGSLDWGQYTSGVSFTMHEGGIVGRGGRANPMTLMDQIAFMSAPRLHTGNLRPGERRVIMEDGEGVVPKDDMRALARGRSRSGGGSAAPIVQPVAVNVIGAPSQPEVRQNEDGSVDIMFEQFEGWQARPCEARTWSAREVDECPSDRPNLDRISHGTSRLSRGLEIQARSKLVPCAGAVSSSQMDGVRRRPTARPAQLNQSAGTSGVSDPVPHPCRFRPLQGVRGERPGQRHVALHDAGLSARDQLVRDPHRDDRRGQVHRRSIRCRASRASFTLIVFNW